jgi:hypothetical protein
MFASALASTLYERNQLAAAAALLANRLDVIERTGFRARRHPRTAARCAKWFEPGPEKPLDRVEIRRERRLAQRSPRASHTAARTCG